MNNEEGSKKKEVEVRKLKVRSTIIVLRISKREQGSKNEKFGVFFDHW